MKINFKPKLTSLENASLIRKFTVLFVVMSFVIFWYYNILTRILYTLAAAWLGMAAPIIVPNEATQNA